MARDIDAIIKQKFAESGDVGLGGLDLEELWPVAYSTPGGLFPQRIQFNQLFRYLSALAVEINLKGPFLDYNNTIDYVIGAFAKGSDGLEYKVFIANGPGSSVVDPVGDLTGTWVESGKVTKSIILSSGTYTKPAGLRYLFVEVAGGGGGGGGAGGGGGGAGGGGGGGGGSYSSKLFKASDISATETLTIGALGTGGADTGGAGGDGGNSSFGSLLVCNGGVGGGGDGSRQSTVGRGSVGGSGGTIPTPGDESETGQLGGTGSLFNTSAVSGKGGDSRLGSGGGGTPEGVGSANGTGLGSGGGGGATATATGQAGGDGTIGAIIITEIF